MTTVVAMTASPAQVGCFVIPSQISLPKSDILDLKQSAPIYTREEKTFNPMEEFIEIDSSRSSLLRRVSVEVLPSRKSGMQRLRKHRKLRRRNRRTQNRKEKEDDHRSDEEEEEENVVPRVANRKRRRPRDVSSDTMTAADLRQWACTTDVDTLRSMFGTNRNRFWGDLDNASARRLYHTLLPRMLMGLYAQGLTTPDELAPLAFEARQAAKKYTRERSNVPGRVLATAYDGFRHLKNYGKWSGIGLSWEELWRKYEDQVLREIWSKSEEELWSEVDEDDVSTKVALKILERSCITNSRIDDALLSEKIEKIDGPDSSSGEQLIALAEKFEQDVNNLLEQNVNIQQQRPLFGGDFTLLRFLVSMKRMLLMHRNFKEDVLDDAS